jgi:hypothetical protein
MILIRLTWIIRKKEDLISVDQGYNFLYFFPGPKKIEKRVIIAEIDFFYENT